MAKNYPIVFNKEAVKRALTLLGLGAGTAAGIEALDRGAKLERKNERLENAMNELEYSKGRELALDKALSVARLKDMTRTRAFGTIGGGLLGGLGGYGLTGLMTKNKWLKALGTLGGGVAGTLGGDYLASKDYSAKHASQNDSNSKFVKNVYTPYKTQNDLRRALVNANDDLNSALKERDFYKNTLGYAAGGTLGGLGGYGLTSLITKNKLLRALGALAGGAAGAGVNYAYNRGNLDGVLSNGMDKLKANEFIKSITSNPKVQSAINYFKQEN